MTPEVRQYQTDGVDAIIAAMRRGVRSLVRVLPTGGGKTVEAAMLAQKMRGDADLLFLVHRRELVRQAFETMSEALPGEAIGVEAAGWPSIPMGADPRRVRSERSAADREHPASESGGGRRGTPRPGEDMGDGARRLAESAPRGPHRDA